MKLTPLPLLALFSAAALSGSDAALLAPNDPSIAANLIGWFTDPGSTYNPGTGVWTDLSGNGNDTAPKAANNPLNLVTGQTIADGGMLDGQTIDYVESDSTPDLISTTLNGGVAPGQFSIVALIDYGSTGNLDRPLGFGSQPNGQAADNFNLAGDGSIRKDNGSVAGSSAVPSAAFFVRADTFNTGTFSDFYITGAAAGTTAININGGSFGAATPGTDEFYFGDLRSNFQNHRFAQVAIFDTNLSQTQIEDVAEFMAANPNFNPIPEPGAAVFALLAGTALAFRRRR